MSSKAKRDAANVASARQSTSDSARGVKTAGGTKRKRSSNMASEAERVAPNDSGPSTSGSAMSVRTPGGTELDFNDPWTARILVTTIAGVGMYLAQGFVTFLHNNPELVKYAVKVAFRLYGEVKDIKLNSITVDLACGSKKKFLKFKKDFEDGKVKVALEEELKEIGCDAKLDLKLVKETPNVVAVEVSEKTMTEKTRKILFANPNSEDEEEKESDQEAVVVKKGNPDNDELEQLANDIDPSDWKKVAKQLKIPGPKITAIHKQNEEFYDKICQMLQKWKVTNGSAATWKKLNQALIDADLKELAEKHCCKKN